MQTVLYSHPDCLRHETPPGHPENTGRLSAVLAALAGEDFSYLHRKEAPRAGRPEIERAHGAAYVESMLSMAPEEDNDWVFFDSDTSLSRHSPDAILRGAGAALAAVDAVAGGEAENAFCAVRPPGHHAERTTAMGFCFVNNVAVAAHHARAAHGYRRCAVVDFDVHHGNGTQDIFWNDPELFYASTHQSPLFPGTGHVHERGVADNILNCPMTAGSGSVEFRRLMDERVLPAVEAFAPDFLFISAGFDAHMRDPLANLRLATSDFLWVTAQLRDLARTSCGGRIVSVLEGGYDHQALGESAAAHVRALMGA